MRPQVDTATIRTVLSTNRMNLRSFSSRCSALRRTHTSTDAFRLLCIRLALPLALPLPSGFVPSARLVVCVSPRAPWLVCYFPCVCIFWDERGGGLTPVAPDTAVIRTVLSTNCVDLGSSAHDVVYVPANTSERRPHSATLYPTSFTLDFLLALTICAQRKTRGLGFPSGPMASG